MSSIRKNHTTGAKCIAYTHESTWFYRFHSGMSRRMRGLEDNGNRECYPLPHAYTSWMPTQGLCLAAHVTVFFVHTINAPISCAVGHAISRQWKRGKSRNMIPFTKTTTSFLLSAMLEAASGTIDSWQLDPNRDFYPRLIGHKDASVVSENWSLLEHIHSGCTWCDAHKRSLAYGFWRR